MLILRRPEGDTNLFQLDVRGKLTRVDYERVVPQLEAAIAAHGSLRLLVTLESFGGWTPSALFDELRFDLRHRKDFARIAVVGETKWQKYKTQICAPFFSGEVRYFESTSKARAWLGEGPAQSSSGSGSGGPSR